MFLLQKSGEGCLPESAVPVAGELDLVLPQGVGGLVDRVRVRVSKVGRVGSQAVTGVGV